MMKNEISIPDHFPELKEEELKAAAKHREEYSIGRDLLAKKDNEAIARRLANDKENKGEDSQLFKQDIIK
jgi:hypothetical protein